MELLQLTRAGDCEQSGNGALALGTPIAEHDLPPLHGRPEGSFGHVVGGCDRLFMHEGEEVGVMHEQRAREVRHLDVRVDGELYFASSAELNDPFECAIAPSYDASEDQILEYARDWVERQGRDPPGSEAEVRELVARASTEDFQKETERRYLDLTQSYGIASVTTTATNPLMWSYYAAGHTGIVVGIDTMRFMQQPFRAPIFPLDVEYARDFPVANFYTDDDFDIVRKTLGTKSYDWHHEEEWRWILIGESGIVRVDPRVITTIVCGLRTDGDTEQRIREWTGGRGGVEMTRVQFCGNSFRLETSA